MTQDNDKPGPTGDFPEGKLNPYDEGGLNFAVGVTMDGNVALYFGMPVLWITLDAAKTRALAAILLARADEAEQHLATKQ